MSRFAVLFLLVALVYHRTPTAFLRAESGWYLCLSQMDSESQLGFERSVFTESYSGHYTPLAFMAEFEMAKIAGTSRAFWRWRQLFALALVGCASFMAISTITRTVGLGRVHCGAVATAITALVLFQPFMVEFVTWPFMIMQLLWLSLLMLALYAVMRLIESLELSRWPWMAACCAYVSMHVSGLGVITVAAVSAALVGILMASTKGQSPLPAPVRKRISMALITLVSAATIHGLAMIALLAARPQPTGTLTVHSVDAIKMVLGFIFNLAWTGVRSFTLTSPGVPSVGSIAYCWAPGLVLIVSMLIGLYNSVWLTSARWTQKSAGVMAVLLFSAAGFFTMVLLITAREISEAPAGGGIVPYFNAFTAMPRYVIPLQYLFVGPVALLLCQLPRISGRRMSVACGAVALAAILAQRDFQAGPMSSLIPGTRISHYSAWKLVLASARECRAANLPLPNLPLLAVTEEISTADIKSFLPLIRHDLRLRADEKLEVVDWFPTVTQSDRYAAVPSLPRLERTLNLLPAGE